MKALPLALLLAACATPRTAFPPLANMHSPTLCYVSYAGNLAEKAAADAELGQRRFVCTAREVEEGRQQFAVMQSQQYQLDAQNRPKTLNPDAAFGLGLFLLSQPNGANPGATVCHTTPDNRTTYCNK